MNISKNIFFGSGFGVFLLTLFLGIQEFNETKKPDPLKELLGDFFLENETDLAVDFFSDNLYEYSGPVTDKITSCIGTSLQTASEGIIYGTVDAAKLAVMLQEKENGTFNRIDVRNTILPVLGHAYINSQINWDWIPESYSYEFYVTKGTEPFWDCYFDLQSETEFFPRFFSETWYKTIATTAPTITSISDDTGSHSADGITSDNTLIISGTGKPNATITIYLDNISIGRTQSTASGSYSFDYTSTTLADKKYNATATSKIGTGGTESAHSQIFEIVIDTIIVQPTINTPTSGNPISGTAESGAIVIVTTPSESTCTTLSNTAGDWNCILSPSPIDGDDVTATSIDKAGNNSNITILDAIENDSTPPPVPNGPADLIDISDTGTDNQDNITKATLPTFETYCTETGNTITLYIDETVVATEICSSQTDEPQIPLTEALTDGQYKVEYTETDDSGNESGKSPLLEILIDRTPPTTHAVLLSPSEPTSNIHAPLVGQCGNDAEAGSVEISTNPTNGFTPYPASQSELDGNGNFEISDLTWIEGTYELIIKCFDKAGNGPTITTITEPVVIDSSAPTSPNNAPDLIDSSDTGTDNTDNITANNTPIFRIECDEANVTVTVYHHEIVIGTGTCLTIGTLIEVLSTIVLPDGSHPITYTYTDSLGNQSGKSPVLPIVIDTTAPIENPELLSPVVPTNNDTAPIVGTCGQDAANGTVNITTNPINGFVTDNGTMTPYPATNIVLDGLGNFTIPVTWNEGEWMLDISCFDKSENGPTTKEQGPVIIDLTSPDIFSTNPDLQSDSDSGVSDMDNYTAETLPIFDIQCTEADSTITVFINKISNELCDDNNGGACLPDYQATLDATCTSIGEIVSVQDQLNIHNGTYRVTHTETDYIGNQSSQSIGIMVTIDTENTNPIITLTSPKSTNKSLSVDLEGSCGAENKGGEVIVTTNPPQRFTMAQYTGSPLGESGEFKWPPEGAHNPFPITWIEGEYDIILNCYDKAGNGPQEKIFPVLFDITNPDISNVNPDLQATSDSGVSDTDNYTSQEFPIFDVQCTEDNSTIILRVNNIPESCDTANGNTCPSRYGVIVTKECDAAGDIVSLYNDTNIQEGVYSVTHTERDSVGNVSSESVGIEVIIDTTAPDIKSLLCRYDSINSLYDDECLYAPLLDLQSNSDTGISDTDNYTADTTPTFNVVCNESTSILTLYKESTQIGTYTCTSVGSVSITSSFLLDGTYSITYTETDLANNTSSSSDPLSITVDTIPPTETPIVTNPIHPTSNIFAPLQGSCGVSAAEGTVIITTNPGNGFTPKYNTVTGLDDAGNYNFTGITWTEGTYDIILNCFDRAGNGPTTETVGSIIIDTTAPSSAGLSIPDLQAESDSGLSNTDNFTSNITPIFDVKCTETNSTLILYAGSSSIGTHTCMSVETVSISSSILSQGPHSITYTETDSLNNTSGHSPALAITVDTSIPIETPTISSPTDGGSLTSNITGSCGASAANGSVKITTDPTNGFTPQYNTSVSLDTSGNFNISGITWTQGIYFITLECFDIAENGPKTGTVGPIDLYIYNWNDESVSWSSCDVSCGTGTETRTISCIRSDGTPSVDTKCSETKPAESQNCTAGSNICGWSEYGAFNSCSESCGGGTQTQTRTCSTGNIGSNNCSGLATNSQSCNTQTCNTYSWYQSGFVCTTNPYAPCNQGINQQTVQCKRNDGIVQTDEFLCTEPKPSAIGGYCSLAGSGSNNCTSTPVPTSTPFVSPFGYCCAPNADNPAVSNCNRGWNCQNSSDCNSVTAFSPYIFATNGYCAR